MKSFKLLLKNFDDCLRKYNPVNYDRLQQPLPEKEIDEYLSNLGIDDERIKILYNWKNGVDYTHGDHRHKIFDFGGLVSLENIIQYEDSGLDYWEKTFFPIITSGDGVFTLFNNKRGSEYGKLYLYAPGSLLIDEPTSYFDSIFSLLETTIEAYEKEVFKYDHKKDWLDQDVKKFLKIAIKYNPKSDYWKSMNA